MNKKEEFIELYNECIKAPKQYTGELVSIRLGTAMEMLQRQVLSSYSLYCICDFKPREDIQALNSSKFIDIPSGWVILRSMYENVLVADYLLINKKFNNTRNIIILIAELHAIKERLIISTNLNSPHSKKDIIRKERDEQLTKIKNCNEYNNLDKKIEKWVNELGTNDRWHGQKYVKLNELAGFNKSLYDTFYKYACSHSHCTALSWDQIGFSSSFLSTTFNYCINFLAHSLEILRKAYEEETTKKFKISDFAKSKIDYYRKCNSYDLSNHE